MNVALVAFHTDVGPLVDHSCEITSINDDGFLICSWCLAAGPEGPLPDRWFGMSRRDRRGF